MVHAPGLRGSCVLLLVTMPFGCGPKNLVIEFDDTSAHSFSAEERREVTDIAEATVRDIRRILPGVPKTVVLRVSTSEKVAVETGEVASNWQPNGVSFDVDAHRPQEALAIVRGHLRAALFHELHHVVRGASVDDTRLRDHVMREGLATAFERDFSGTTPPWAIYPAEVSQWSQEILKLPDDASRAQWLFQHPDGRRWIGLRVGTYWVDCATKQAKRTSAELVRVPTNTLLGMCPSLQTN